MRILAIASSGGHWSELELILEQLKAPSVITVATKLSCSSELRPYDYLIQDCNVSRKIDCLKSFFQIFKILRAEKPELVITTGAAPGLVSVSAAKLLGIRTIWVDSIANTDQLSRSGFLASFFVDLAFTQWRHLESSRTKFIGSIF
ncbi:hypothetical protein PN836_020425 [Ningiella sp. W23]|uniref:hypothetical protein n=1 Tax=Ningiella sp. W23 TaxID=3023715 RepID=UPI0037573ABD